MCALRTKLIVLQRFVKKYERKKKGRNKNSLLLGLIVMITAINKKIKQIRLSGLVEEKECVFRHLAEQKQFELDFAKVEYDYKCTNSKLEKEYFQKVEDTKFDRSVIELNFKKQNVSKKSEVL